MQAVESGLTFNSSHMAYVTFLSGYSVIRPHSWIEQTREIHGLLDGRRFSNLFAPAWGK